MVVLQIQASSDVPHSSQFFCPIPLLVSSIDRHTAPLLLLPRFSSVKMTLGFTLTVPRLMCTSYIQALIMHFISTVQPRLSSVRISKKNRITQKCLLFSPDLWCQDFKRYLYSIVTINSIHTSTQIGQFCQGKLVEV